MYYGWVIERYSYPESVLTQGLGIEQRWPGWTTIPHIAFMLAEMKSLKKLRFLVERSTMYKEGYDNGEDVELLP
jgi:hypothetical protein